MTPQERNAWFETEGNTKPSNVIHLPRIDRTLLNGMKSSEMVDYCRVYSLVESRDREFVNG